MTLSYMFPLLGSSFSVITTVGLCQCFKQTWYHVISNMHLFTAAFFFISSKIYVVGVTQNWSTV